MTKEIVKKEMLKMIGELLEEGKFYANHDMLLERNYIHAQRIAIKELAKRLKIELV